MEGGRKRKGREREGGEECCGRIEEEIQNSSGICTEDYIMISHFKVVPQESI